MATARIATRDEYRARVRGSGARGSKWVDSRDPFCHIFDFSTTARSSPRVCLTHSAAGGRPNAPVGAAALNRGSVFT